MSCIPMKASRRFGGTYRLHNQGTKEGEEKHQHDVGTYAPLAFSLRD
jgi:hypothetical protein